jgi:hypothetical protein
MFIELKIKTLKALANSTLVAASTDTWVGGSGNQISWKP